jgi:hypothetical protein
MKTKLSVFIVLVVLIGVAACKTTKPSPAEAQAEKSSEKISAQAEKAADDFRVVDWKDRSIGEIASPVWLYPAVRGNWNYFKSEWPVSPSKVLKIGVARHATLNGAQTIADVQYAARLANQLKQAVLSRAGISLGSDNEFDVVNNAVTQAQVNVAGQERLTDFWQLVETTGADGRKSRMYSYWVVYACDSAVWDQITAKYIYDVVGKLPDTKTQQTIAGMFNEINAETKFEREKAEAQFIMELAAQQKALQEPPKSTSEIRIAYQSNDPAVRAAAGTTAADADYIAALLALAGQ